MIVSGERPDDFYFMEMNTRLQVEHPVTEMVYGIDLVEWQLRVAAGEPLPWAQADLVPSGHAIEARLYAEDPARGFVPTGGTVLGLREPAGPGVRVDSGISAGSVIGSDYDPMLAKVIAHGPDRRTALARLDRALAGTAILGVGTNIGFLRALLGDEDVAAGRLHTGLVEDRLEHLAGGGVPTEVLAAAALEPLRPTPGQGAWERREAWRLGGPAWIFGRLRLGDLPAAVALRATTHGWLVSVDGSAPVDIGVSWHDDGISVTGPAGPVRLLTARVGEVVHVAGGRGSWAATPDGGLGRAGAAGPAGFVGMLRSPMPGTVLDIRVGQGDAVVAGQVLAVVEAMKMEYSLIAPADGIVLEVPGARGRRVALDEVVVVIGPPPDTALAPVTETSDGDQRWRPGMEAGDG